MIRPARLGLALLIAAAVPGQACAQRSPVLRQTPLTVEDVIGFWSLSAAGKPGCRLALNRMPTGTGYGVYLERCGGDLAAITRWRLDGGRARLEDSRGRAILTLTRQTVDRFSGRGRDGRDYVLERAPMA